MSEIDKDRLRNKIVKSKELTALEKRYLENLIAADSPDLPAKTGHWIPHPGKFGTLYECSCCKIWVPIATKTCLCGAKTGGDET